MGRGLVSCSPARKQDASITPPLAYGSHRSRLIEVLSKEPHTKRVSLSREDRLRLILRAWERSPESVLNDDPNVDRLRVERRVAELDDRLIAIDAEFADLETSAIWRLKAKIDDARSQGWDLYAEIVNEVKRQIARANARLISLRRQVR